MAEITIEAKESVIAKVRRLLQVLAAEGLDIEAAYLYGSYAMGNPRQYSDIDVAVISPDLSGIRVDDWVHLNRLASEIDVRIEVMGFRPEQFRDEHPLSYKNGNTHLFGHMRLQSSL